MRSLWRIVGTMILLVHSRTTFAHREHKVHNIVLYPDKHSWCKTTPIKQVVAWPQCSSQELDNNVCVGACFSYMVPHSEPSAPGDLIRPYCDSCQPLDSVWHTVTLDCKDEENNPITMQKKVQIITNCSCSSCMETSRIKPDYNTLLQSLAEESLDKNVNVIHETPDLLLNPNLNSSKNSSGGGVEANERFLQLMKQLKGSEKLDESATKALLGKFVEDIDFDTVRELLKKEGNHGGEKHEKHEQQQQHHHHELQQQHTELQQQQQQQQQQQHHHHHHHHKEQQEAQQQHNEREKQEDEEQPDVLPQQLHRGPHHSMVLDAGVKEKIDVEPHYLRPAVAGQEISYILDDKSKKKDF
ncbi:uncharacterized protein [Prorops nasuta]|uniref:uncharacterized protein n=1 Tax=Prorops nasuta TaxID=863751 RepID=UPI0034CFE651